MSFKNLFLRTFAIAALGAASLFAPLGQAQAAGQQYVTLNPAQPSDTPDKIEILEFFAYSCPHCAAMQPMVEKWAKTLPSNVVLRQVPVAFNASMTDLQKLYYSLQALDRMDLNDEVFKAIHTEHKRIFEKFYRRGKPDGRAPGTGLGLSIARGFTEAMGGKIQAESPAVKKRGTRIVLRFPSGERKADKAK